MKIEPKAIIRLALFFLLLVLILPRSGHTGDIGLWTWWARHIFEFGLGRIYEIEANYQPFFLYMLQLYGWVEGSLDDINSYRYYIRVFPLLFDFLPVVILLLLHRYREWEQGLYWFLLFNAGYLYNTLIWGQVDSIHSTLSILALALGLRFPVLSVLLFLLAWNTKIQAIVFLPLLAFVWLLGFKSWKKVILAVFLVAVAELLLLLPFIQAGTLQAYLNMVMGAVDYYPKISLNAFNVWDLILNEQQVLNGADSDIFLVFSYKTWGLALFFLSAGTALLPVFLKVVRALITRRISHRFWEMTFLSGGMAAILFFFFNTQMHERYVHPAVVFLFFYSVYRRNYLLYALLSLAYFLNLEKVLKIYDISYHTLIFDRGFIAGIYLLVLLLGIWRLFSAYGFGKDGAFIIRRLMAKGQPV